MAALLCSIPHELGHIGAIYVCGCKIRRIVLSPLGAVIELKNPPRSRPAAAAISLCGAAVNFVLAALFFFPSKLFPEPELCETLCDIAAFELVCGSFNLLPVKPLDGRCALDSLFGESGRVFLDILSGVTMAALFAFAAYSVMFLTPNFMPLLVCACLFSSEYLGKL